MAQPKMTWQERYDMHMRIYNEHWDLSTQYLHEVVITCEQISAILNKDHLEKEDYVELNGLYDKRKSLFDIHIKHEHIANKHHGIASAMMTKKLKKYDTI